MPRVVPLTSNAASFSAAARASHGSTLIGPPTASAISSARRVVRLMRRISGTPASSSDTTMARAAPPAPSSTAGPAAPRQRWLDLLQVGDEAEAVGIVAEDGAVVAHHQHVDGADALGDRGQFVDEAERALLVRQGDVAAAEAERRQRADALLQLARVRGERDVGAVDPELLQPVAMQPRRARVVDRPAEDAGDAGLAGESLDAHRVTIPCSRRMPSTGSKGKPRMVK